ncbi:enoyl-CoA hydratase-related protein [Bacteriovoracales bacterium]|nr:enoyl-CoA hydratase-related protein [Bacteriovoracales bacterium]
MSFYDQNFPHLKIRKGESNLDSSLWIGLDNPQTRNAYSNEMVKSLVDVLRYSDHDSKIKVIVLYGEGTSFSSGGDIKAMEMKEGMFKGEPNELRLNYVHGIQTIPKTIEELHTPLIAMVNGPAIGAGCDLATMCDLRIGSEKSKFGVTFSKLSLVPGDGGVFFLSRVVGYSKAMEMFLTGDLYQGKTAYEMGLLNYFVENSDNLIEETESLVSKILSNGPVALSMTKRALKHGLKGDLSSCLDLMAAYQGISQRTQDHFEALKAFKEKRPANFIGE